MHLLERPGINDGLDEPITGSQCGVDGAYDGTPIAKMVRGTHPTFGELCRDIGGRIQLVAHISSRL